MTQEAPAAINRQLDVTEVADLLRVSRETVYRLARQPDGIPHARVGQQMASRL